MRQFVVCQGTRVCYSVVPRLSSSCSFPLSSSRLRLSPPSPSACSSIPEFLRVLNFSETTSLCGRLGPGLDLYIRPLLLPPSRLTTSEAERRHGDRGVKTLRSHEGETTKPKTVGHQILHDDALKLCNQGKQGGFCCVILCQRQSLLCEGDRGVNVQGPEITSTQTHPHLETVRSDTGVGAEGDDWICILFVTLHSKISPFVSRLLTGDLSWGEFSAEFEVRRLLWMDYNAKIVRKEQQLSSASVSFAAAVQLIPLTERFLMNLASLWLPNANTHSYHTARSEALIGCYSIFSCWLQRERERALSQCVKLKTWLQAYSVHSYAIPIKS